ncbi:hypothetical protein AV530_008644 [Patagioenas fasciata monilis]|uniref:Uncharacterized protein n=1 Tax=Patagioenas fasciata monilis TaxID=372326 RepID=A0A1V4L0T4_PATFA|nr:hypothetical protein AV530_008644 [Patagioenas fasciata monilis]
MHHANLKKLGQEGFGQFLQPYIFLMIIVLASQRSPTEIVVGSFFTECGSVWHSYIGREANLRRETEKSSLPGEGEARFICFEKVML